MIESVFGLWSSVFLVLPELQLGVTVPDSKEPFQRFPERDQENVHKSDAPK